MKQLLEFAILRYVPDEVKEEFINVGIVFFLQKDKYINFKYTNDWGRILSFDEEVDLPFLNVYLEGMYKEFTQDKSMTEETFNEYKNSLSIYVNTLQFSPIKKILINRGSLHEEEEVLFDYYIGVNKTLC